MNETAIIPATEVVDDIHQNAPTLFSQMSDTELLIDGHVHIHHPDTIGELLSCAATNLARNASTKASQSILCLTECAGVDEFARMSVPRTIDGPEDQSTAWTIERTKENNSIRLHDTAGRTLIAIAGRQVVTAERLEVLAIGVRDHIPDGQPIETVIMEVNDRGGLPVIPWGFGKWTGQRGEIVNRLIAHAGEREFLLGDNGGRLSVWREPRLFAVARARAIPALAGSDPLPFGQEHKNVGRYLSRVRAPFDIDRPAESLMRTLRHADVLESVGAREALVPFLIKQSRMQIHMRLRKRVAVTG